jgi:hypothetical protein
MMELQIVKDGQRYLMEDIKSSPQRAVLGTILSAKMTMPAIPEPKKWR